MCFFNLCNRTTYIVKCTSIYTYVIDLTINSRAKLYEFNLNCLYTYMYKIEQSVDLDNNTYIRSKKRSPANVHGRQVVHLGGLIDEEVHLSFGRKRNAVRLLSFNLEKEKHSLGAISDPHDSLLYSRVLAGDRRCAAHPLLFWPWRRLYASVPPHRRQRDAEWTSGSWTPASADAA